MGIAAKTVFNRTRRVPCKRRRACQPLRRVSTFSITRCQSCIRSQRSTSGTPKYRIRRLAMGIAKVWAQPASSSVDKPNPTRVDLAQFKQRPEKSVKISSMVVRVCDAAVDPWIKKVVSSAYCSRGMPPGTMVDSNPMRAPCEHTCVLQTTKAPTTKMNSKGANGNPCRMPRCGWIQAPCGRPLTKTAKEEVITHCFTHRTHVFGNP